MHTSSASNSFAGSASWSSVSLHLPTFRTEIIATNEHGANERTNRDHDAPEEVHVHPFPSSSPSVYVFRYFDSGAQLHKVHHDVCVCVGNAQFAQLEQMSGQEAHCARRKSTIARVCLAHHGRSPAVWCLTGFCNTLSTCFYCTKVLATNKHVFFNIINLGNILSFISAITFFAITLLQSYLQPNNSVKIIKTDKAFKHSIKNNKIKLYK